MGCENIRIEGNRMVRVLATLDGFILLSLSFVARLVGMASNSLRLVCLAASWSLVTKVTCHTVLVHKQETQ